MALVRISDVVVPAVYQDYGVSNSPEKTAFWESGVIVRNADFDTRADGPSNITTMPFWKDIDATVAPNLSDDDPTHIAVPEKIGTGIMLARTAYLNKGFSDADLVTELSGSDPMTRIKSRFDTYWMRSYQRRLIAATNGVLADNIANDAGDMVAIPGGQFSRTAFTTAMFTVGDLAGNLNTIVVHSAVGKQMVDANDIEFLIPSGGTLPVPFYMGRRVVMDDNMPASSTTVALGTLIFTSVLFGEAAFGYGQGTPQVPVEVQRYAEQGNGGGVEQLWERKTWLIHPFGFSFTSASVAGMSPTIAELGTASNWDRVLTRKQIPMAFIKSTLTVPT